MMQINCKDGDLCKSLWLSVLQALTKWSLQYTCHTDVNTWEVILTWTVSGACEDTASKTHIAFGFKLKISLFFNFKAAQSPVGTTESYTTAEDSSRCRCSNTHSPRCSGGCHFASSSSRQGHTKQDPWRATAERIQGKQTGCNVHYDRRSKSMILLFSCQKSMDGSCLFLKFKAS